MKKKPNRKYMTTRTQYKAAKSYDHAQFDAFCTKIYAEGFKDGVNSVKGADVTDVMERIKAVKGIGEKRLTQIEQAVSELFNKGESEGKSE